MVINRSKIKYALKKILPVSIFNFIMRQWQTSLIGIVENFDAYRLKRFTRPHVVTLTHKKKDFLLLLDPLNGFIDTHIYLYGVYEPFILDIMANKLTEGMTFVDIGTNIGEHSMYAARLVGPTGHVLSFEPIPRIFAQLRKSIHSNHYESIIEAHNVALGEESRTETLHLNAKNIGGSSLVEGTQEDESIVVTIRKGDDYLLPLKRIDMIKIDVEGYEYEVLSGIKESLHTHHPTIILEFSGHLYLEHRNNHGEKILSLLNRLGYSLYDIEDSMKMITSQNQFINSFKNEKKQTNLLCIFDVFLRHHY